MTERRLLVANRGEIAVRIMRSARALGFTTIAIHSDADREAPHVSAANIAIGIGPAEASQSYLSIARVIEAARATRATHVHPGYGFLSENAAFAQACADAALVFVGPSPAAITLMGDKGRARAAMIAAGVPCVPGYQGDDQSEARLVSEADRIGYPIMIKASSGGGGRGLRVVQDRAALVDALATVRSEAERSFGQGSVVLERALSGVRHVEIQVFGDRQGNVIALGERDCSTQRRNQKVLEEAPSPAVTPELRTRMQSAAVKAAQAAHYVGAGTVEMLLDGRGEFYFLEMNTRLQVEHPVTEMITGQDLVQWQLRVADGEPLPWSQADVRLSGHAIEARLYAESPETLMPQTGVIASCTLPQGDGVRVDHALRDGVEVTAHYDPMLAKVIAHGPTREVARARLIEALRQTHVLGVLTNKALLLRLLRHATFASGAVDTAFASQLIDTRVDPASHTTAARHAVLSAIAIRTADSANRLSPHADLRGFRSGPRVAVPYKLQLGEQTHEANVVTSQPSGRLGLAIQLDGQGHEVVVEALSARTARLRIDGTARDVAHWIDGERIVLDLGEGSLELVDCTLPAADRKGGVASGEVSAPMDGVIVRLDVQVSARVEVGQALLTLESMKLQHVIRAAVAGEVTFVGTQAGSQVKRGTVLVRIT